MTSGNSKLKSSALRFLCNLPGEGHLQCSRVVHHGSGVTLRLSHLAMSDVGGGTDEFNFFSGDVGRFQAHDQVFNRLAEDIPCALRR